MSSEHRTYVGVTSFLNTYNERMKTTNCVGLFRELFSKFENEVWNYSSLRPEEAYKIDLQLPLFIIESFAKLFRLWREFAILKNLIKPKEFQTIHDVMNEFFCTDISHFEIFCDICEEQFPIKSNNLQYSYELHVESDYHREILNNFNYLVGANKYKPAESQKEDSKLSDDSRKGSVNGDGSVTGYIVRYEDKLHCILCDKALRNNDAANHLTSWSHLLNEKSFEPSDTNYILQLDGIYCCRICQRKVQTTKDGQAQHLMSKSHKLVENCYALLREQTNITLVNKNNGEFICELCDEFGSGWKALEQHCQLPNHQTCDVSIVSENDNNFIILKYGRCECCLCDCVLKNCEISEHKQSAEHRRRLAIINNADTCQAQDSVHHSVDSDAFKNNDIYVDIESADDTFKCLLCNANGKLATLKTHCSSNIHLCFKKNVEELSVKLMNSMNMEYGNSIDVIEDFYFCRICDLVMENEDDKISHERTKSHIMNVRLRNMFNENGTLIVIQKEDEPKIYECKLCSRMIDGDSNVIAHSNSIRHKKLLSIVERLGKHR